MSSLMTPGVDPVRWTRLYWSIAGTIILAWSGVVFLAVPATIRRAYEGRAPAWINGLITGQDLHPVERYLDTWRTLATTSTWLLVVTALVVFLVVKFRSQLAVMARQTLAREPTVPHVSALLLTVWLGLIAGFLEYVLRLVKYRIDGIFSPWSNPESVWVLPLAVTALFLAITLLLIVALRAVGVRTISLRLLLLGFVSLTLYGLLRAAALGLHPLAAAVLAVGIGFRLASGTERVRDRWLPLVRRSAIPACATFILLGVVRLGFESTGERRRLEGLPAAPPGAPNVLLIILDTVRGQSVSAHGYARPTTPYLEQMATDGIVFDRAMASAPWTLPSHGTMFTGRYPFELSTDFEQPLDARYPTLAEILQGAGYATGGFVANVHYASERSGLNRGFLHYEAIPVSIDAAFRTSWLGQRAWQAVRGWFGFEGVLARKLAADINADYLDWLDGVPDRPWFVFLNYFDAHMPYIRDDRFVEAFAGIIPRDSILLEPGRYRPAEELQSRIDSYDSAIASMDQAIRRLMEELDRRGQLDNTLVIVTSDHGEHLGEYGLLQHTNSLYTPLIHVPLIIRPPGGVARPVRTDVAVSLRDIPATILDVVGASHDFNGQSLRAHWMGDPSAVTEFSVAISEVNPNPYDVAQSVDNAMRSVVDRNLHYIVDADGAEQLFDIERDPWEEVNLMADSSARVALRRLLGMLDSVVGAPLRP